MLQRITTYKKEEHNMKIIPLSTVAVDIELDDGTKFSLKELGPQKLNITSHRTLNVGGFYANTLREDPYVGKFTHITLTEM